MSPTRKPTSLRFEAAPGRGEVSALLLRPDPAHWLYVLGHGAGAGMEHPFLDEVSAGLAARNIATFRYQFPYMEAGRRRPDPGPVLQETVRSAVRAARGAASDLPLVIGGKSMGGRMSSLAAAEKTLDGPMGLIFLGFPLHPPKRDGVERAKHLSRVGLPTLFLQGTRDKLANLAMITEVTASLSAATLHVVEGGDHSFEVLKRSGRTRDEVMAELADTIEHWGRRWSRGQESTNLRERTRPLWDDEESGS